MKIKLPAKITHRIYETGSSFHVKQRSMGNVSFLLTKSFLLVLTKLWFWPGGLGTRLSLYEVETLF